MGIWDSFCFACGCPCHHYFENNIEYIEGVYEKYLKNGKRIKGKFDKELCKKIDNDPKYIEKLKNIVVKTRWLDKCTFLTNCDKVIHDCIEVGANIVFKDKKGVQYYQDVNYNIYPELENKTKKGIFLHDDCYKFIKSKYKIDLKYSDVAIIPSSNDYNKINHKIKYGEIEKYWAQNFDFEKMMIDNNEYMIEPPLKNEKNAQRIKKIITQFKFNTDKKRRGPAVSATFYPEKTIKYGINGLLWIKSNGKWSEMKAQKLINEKGKIEVSALALNNIGEKERKYLEGIVCYGEQSEKPLMIKNIKDKGKNKIEIEFIGTKEEIDKLLKMIN